jgi:sugar O-acyltransferase (sialic acid O-acetyltransferase NeuD family)
MKDLIIIGAGGFGRSIYQIATESIGYNEDFVINGFIDDNINALDGFKNYPPILGKISDYKIEVNDYFICSVGSVKTKKIITDLLTSKGAKFYTLIHKFSQISINAILGEGCIIARNAIIGTDATVGKHVLIQASSVIGHDSLIGDYSRIDCNVVCVGGIIVEECATIHTSSIINHKVKVGKNAVVGAGSFVIRKVPENVTVYGNPAKKL